MHGGFYMRFERIADTVVAVLACRPPFFDLLSPARNVSFFLPLIGELFVCCRELPLAWRSRIRHRYARVVPVTVARCSIFSPSEFPFLF